MLIRILPVWRFVHGTPNALRSPVQESPTKISQGGRVTGPATWPYSRQAVQVEWRIPFCLIRSWLNADSIVHGSTKALLASKVLLCRLD